ncbi:response regulator [Rubrobacter tropicus]|uniref:Response regulator n=1 Tax=Rubrobacter tropicus TaxID=2653851 RepID=A0A6G8Q8Y5_9ACTN|nr:response regulator transcription factor [Rubrobacter tropicus]QIN82909.1 response regulator [Rubrobacter tropicus]
MKIVVVDGQPVVRVGVKTVLDAEENMETVGEAASVRQAIELVRRAAPDIVVLDLDLEGQGGGLELCRKIKSMPGAPGVVVFTFRNSREEVFSSRLSGADSFVHKGESTGKLLEAIRETRSGKKVWFLGEGDNPGPHRHFNAEEPSLTPKEKEIFALLVKRRTNAEIAAELSISHQTVKNHVSNVLKKLGADSRIDLL